MIILREHFLLLTCMKRKWNWLPTFTISLSLSFFEYSFSLFFLSVYVLSNKLVHAIKTRWEKESHSIFSTNHNYRLRCLLLIRCPSTCPCVTNVVNTFQVAFTGIHKRWRIIPVPFKLSRCTSEYCREVGMKLFY